MFSASIYISDTYSHQDIQAFGQIFEGFALSHMSKREPTADSNNDEHWLLRWFFEDKPHAAHLTQGLNTAFDLSLTDDMWEIASFSKDINWLEHVYAQNPPITAGPFFVYGSHFHGDIPSDALTLNIDAITAFGSGDHGTTKGCLLAMAELKEQGICPWNVLDLGTGSGILALAAWKLWKTPVLGTDIDEEAINVCHRHAEQNNAPLTPQDLTFTAGDGFSAPLLQDKKPFDLIIANILAGPLKEMAGAMYEVTDENGYVILSGILNEQADDVLGIYQSVGFTLKSRDSIDEWTTLVLQNI